jgi:hypothetical protein
MLLELIPDAFQQISIAWFLLYCAYRLGERKINWEVKVTIDLFFRKVVKYNAITVAILYAEAIFLEMIVMSEEDIPDDLKEEGTLTEQWLKQHNDFFWFVLSVHQVLLLGIIGRELMKETHVKKLLWFGIIPPLIQWHIGLFATNPIAGAVFGLILEMVAPLLLLVYAFQICFSQLKVRAAYGFAAVLSYIISTLPVLFLGTQMQSAHHALYLTIFFGVISFFCWARLTSKTPTKIKDLSIDGKEHLINRQQTNDSPKEVAAVTVPSFVIDEEEKDTTV